MWVLVCVPAILLLIQPSVDVSGKPVKNGLNAWAPAPIWETQALGAGFSLTQLWLLLAFGK